MPDISAKEVMQGIANCASPMEHRGGMAFTRNPRDNRYLYQDPPAEATPDAYVPPSVMYSPQFTRQVFIDIPEWQNVPWEPIPYPEFPDWKPVSFPEWPISDPPLDDPTVVVDGPLYAGPTTTSSVTTNTINTTRIVNEGDTFNLNGMVVFGPVTHNGPVFNQHRHINNGPVINNQFVQNTRRVINRGVSHNTFVHNYFTINHGPMQSYGPSDFYSTSTFGGDVHMSGNVYVQDSAALGKTTHTLLTDVEWTGTELVKKYRSVTFLGSSNAEATATVVSGTSCPSTPLPAAASNWTDTP